MVSKLVSYLKEIACHKNMQAIHNATYNWMFFNNIQESLCSIIIRDASEQFV